MGSNFVCKWWGSAFIADKISKEISDFFTEGSTRIFSLHILQIFGSRNNIRVGTGVKISEGKYGVEVFFKALQQAQNNNGETGLHSNS